MQIEITTDETPLSRNVWTFYVHTSYGSTIDVKLNGYSEQTRPSTRHRKWESTQRWPARHGYAHTVKLAAPTIPPEVEAELRKRIADAVRFDWNEPK